ncbi:putative aldehyde oxidase-like protein-like [Capsicum annuum]|nr:putative aldehyde oxidase-like protein-like [Capsicum annuum]
MRRYSISMKVFVLFCCLWAVIVEAEYLKYKDPKQPMVTRIKDLMKRMTLEEKIGQMTQIERKVASVDVMKQYFIGSVLSGGGSVPAPKASAEDWINMVNDIQMAALSTRLGIPMIYGIDAVHGHNNVYNATIFPHNIGLGVTRQLIPYDKEMIIGIEVAYIPKRNDPLMDPDLVKRIGAATALEVRATGIPYAFAPCIAVCRDPRWGRCYESYSEDHKIVRTMTEIIHGLQGDLPANSRKGVPFVGGKSNVAACAKHFVGDGGTVRGIDENNTVINSNGLYGIHMPAYYDSIIKGVSTVMVSYSSWNGEKMHANRDLVTGFLKGKLNFRRWCSVIGKTVRVDKSPILIGEWTSGTTILNAVKNTVHPSTQVVYHDNPDVNFVKSNHFSYAIVVVGETPYAEMFGDSANLTIDQPGPSTISNVCGIVKCVVVVISGR